MENTMEWLKGLPAAIAAITEEEFADPGPKIEKERMEVLGELTREQKQLHALWRRTEKESEQAIIEAKYARSDEALVTRAVQMNKRADILRKLFWMVVGDGFQSWGAGKTMAVGAGYQVVQYDRKKPSLSDIISIGPMED
jgi:hypothetical protein